MFQMGWNLKPATRSGSGFLDPQDAMRQRQVMSSEASKRRREEEVRAPNGAKQVNVWFAKIMDGQDFEVSDLEMCLKTDQYYLFYIPMGDVLS